VSFQTELDARDEHTINFVIKIGSEYFSKHQVDADSGDIIGTGTGIKTAHVNIVNAIKVNANSIDLRTVRATINSTTITITEDIENETFTNFIGASETALTGEDIEIFVGIVNESFDFSEYVSINNFIIQKVKLLNNGGYSILARARQDEMQVATFDAKGNLVSAISDSVTTIIVQATGDIFQAVTYLKINNEYILTTGKSFNPTLDQTTFTAVSRGVLGSTAAEADVETEVNEYTKLEENPVTLLLQIMISGSGASGAGAIYDVLPDGLAIDEDLIDIADMESKRSTFFSGETFRLFIGEVENTLKFIEAHLLQASNIRLIESEDGISIAVLDQTDPGVSVADLDESTVASKPGWETDKSRIINRFRILWDWTQGTENFNRVSEFNDTDSQNIYGVKVGPDIKMRGALAALGGLAITNTRGNRFSARFSTPQTTIKARKVFLKKYAIKIGDKVLFSHSDVPARGGGRGVSAELEVLSKSINMNTGRVEFSLVYTSYFNIRLGLIAPSPVPTAVTSNKIFTVPDGTCYKAGDFIRLWNNAGSVYYADATQEIESVVGNVITLVGTGFTTTVDTVNTRIKLADYDEASAFQRGRYAYISPSSGFFDDGSKAYQIDF